jgi:indolepyruvate ferredoxin oxidoreductase beta subunit
VDFARIAEAVGSVISASLYGALAGSGALPFTREQFEAPIRAFPKAAGPSLAAFAAAFDEAAAQVAAATARDTAGAPSAATQGAGGPAPSSSGPVQVTIGRRRPETAEDRKQAAERERTRVARTDPESLVGPELKAQARRTSELPAAARSTVLHGVVRTAVYQGPEYADSYLERVAAVAAVDPDAEGAAELTREAARNLALWMCYQDTIQVALQKTRQHRLDRVRSEAKADDGHLVQVREYLHPQVEEITDTTPAGLGAVLLKSALFQRLVHAVTHRGIVLNTTSATGYTTLAILARLRPLRPRSLRFVRERAAIDEWLGLALAKAAEDPALAIEIIECQQILKGYGSTYANGGANFELLMTTARELPVGGDSAERLRQLRTAALADENGATLRAELAASPVP